MPWRFLSPSMLSVVSASVLALVWFATYRFEATSWADRGVQWGFIGLADTPAAPAAERIAHLVDPLPFAAMAAALIAIALVRRRPRLAVAAGVILGCANVTTQALKRITADPRAFDLAGWQGGMGQELWPSGHTTAVMTLVLCVVLVSPPRWRPSAAAGGALFVVAVVYSILLLAWHLPSDVLGGFLVATGWTFATVAVLHAADRRWPVPAEREEPLPVKAVVRPAIGVAVLAAAFAAGVAASSPDSTMAHAVDHSAFMLGAPLIGAAALALATGVAVSLRR